MNWDPGSQCRRALANGIEHGYHSFVYKIHIFVERTDSQQLMASSGRVQPWAMLPRIKSGGQRFPATCAKYWKGRGRSTCCWWFRNPAVTSWGEGSLSHYLQGFSTIPGGWEWDFWTINSCCSEFSFQEELFLKNLIKLAMFFMFAFGKIPQKKIAQKQKSPTGRKSYQLSNFIDR